MVVIFLFKPDYSRVVEVFWEEGGGVKSKILREDGVVETRDDDTKDLHDTMMRVGGPYTPMYPAEVDDLRLAFKYLGKAADLVETLPEASIAKPKPAGATA